MAFMWKEPVSLKDKPVGPVPLAQRPLKPDEAWKAELKECCFSWSAGAPAVKETPRPVDRSGVAERAEAAAAQKKRRQAELTERARNEMLMVATLAQQQHKALRLLIEQQQAALAKQVVTQQALQTQKEQFERRRREVEAIDILNGFSRVADTESDGSEQGERTPPSASIDGSSDDELLESESDRERVVAEVLSAGAQKRAADTAPTAPPANKHARKGPGPKWHNPAKLEQSRPPKECVQPTKIMWAEPRSAQKGLSKRKLDLKKADRLGVCWAQPSPLEHVPTMR